MYCYDQKMNLTFFAFDLRECNSPGSELLVATLSFGGNGITIKKNSRPDGRNACAVASTVKVN